MRKPVSVLLVEDHALLRRELRRTLDEDADIRVAGEAANGAEALDLAEVLHPDVVVMDLTMPVMDGIQAARRMLARNPDIAVLILSMNSQERFIARALDAGVRGYVVKDAADLDLAAAVKDVAAGKQVLPCAVES
ncbi:MAG TPA: response regulator transcription factor [Bryobacteraceae bacterium]|nr:response regulator transcription factor [Bryobacteraceae bacterium]